MKGQASVEALLILAAILAVSSGLIYHGLDSSNAINGISAARTGAENAISRLELKYDISIQISGLNVKGDSIEFSLEYWGEPNLKTTIKNEVEEDSLEFLHQAFKNNFPNKPISSVKTQHHNFKVSATVSRVEI